MDTEEFKRRAGQMEYIAAGSEMHLLMHRAAAEAQRITAVINGGFHAQEELLALFSQLTGREPGEGFALFPPFYTDFGKNIAVGKGVFINSGCCFQDQGGIEIGDGCLIGHQVVIATLDHDLDPANRKSMRPAPVRLARHHSSRRFRRRRCRHRGGRSRHEGRPRRNGRGGRSRAHSQKNIVFIVLLLRRFLSAAVLRGRTLPS